MWFHIPLTALLLQATPSQQAHAVTPLSADKVLEAANHAVLHFITTWRAAWLDDADRMSRDRNEIRLRDVHCHWDGSFGTNGRGSSRPPTLIHHGSRRSMCPNWIPTSEGEPDDEDTDRDVSLSPGRRRAVRAARAELLDSLALLDARKPGDEWITGQRVRFLVDQKDYATAIDVARKCTARAAWCAQLAGFALHAAGHYRSADSAFDAAAAALPHDERCDWIDLRLLIDEDSRGAYEHLDCEDRPAANEKLWWLTTPLFSDTADDRRSTHFARKVMVQLHSALTWDERYDWRGRFGGESVAEMLTRYGWPAYSNWGGFEEERSHAAWMTFYDSTRTATAEYPRDRLHLIPSFNAVADPFHARSDAWQINMPQLNPDDEPADQWWPAEHYARSDGPIVQLTEQTVLLRRDNDLLLATAAGTPSTRDHVARDGSGMLLMRSTGAHKVESLDHQTFTSASAVVLTAHVPAAPALIGAELRGAKRGEVSARTRLGIDPPKPLDALHAGETAISEPVLLSTEDDAPTSSNAALHQMLGTTHVRGDKLGLYWETYGFAPSDSVDVSVVLSRHEQLSKMRRVGMFLHVAHDINGSVAMHWREPDLGTNGWSIPGVLPIRARSIRLDMSRIEPGHYNVQVLVARRGVLVPISASRDFVFDGK
jgi:hypothetical protein